MKVFKPIVSRIEQDGTQVLGEELIYEGPEIVITSDSKQYLSVVDKEGEVVFWNFAVEPVPPELELLQGGKAEDE